MLIYIVRHGETNLNAKGIMQGWLDEPLNRNGLNLAKITGREMRGIIFDCCISSPLIRAKETAEIILHESGNLATSIVYDDRLREIHFGDLEGTILNEKEKQLFFTNPLNYGVFPNGEGVQDVCTRTQAFLKELMSKDDGKKYLISTHGCALRAMLNALYENPNDFWHGHVPYNCVVNIVESEKGIAKLIEDDKVYYNTEYCIDRYAKE